MKIAVFNGQNHRGSTYHIGKMLVDSISGENEITEFFLPKDLNHFCMGCYRCIENETKCPYYEEKQKLLKVIEQADLLIFTTPNYCMAPSAGMKSFMELTFTYWMSHKPRKCMFEKKAVVISTTAGIGANWAIKPVKRMLFYWGVPWVKTFGISVQAMNWAGVSDKKKAKIQSKISKLAKVLSDEKKPRVPVKTKLLFHMMAGMQKAGMGSGAAERKYWGEQGWLEKNRPWTKK